MSQEAPRPSTRVETLDRPTRERIAAARRADPLTLGRFLRRDRGDLDDAGRAYRRCLELLEPALRPDHPELGELRRDYAALLRREGRGAEADALLLRAGG